jgi:hypothetical protein
VLLDGRLMQDGGGDCKGRLICSFGKIGLDI